VKRFLKEPGGADVYQNLRVIFIPGKSPELVVSVDGDTSRRIDLTAFDSELALHRVVLDQGFVIRDDVTIPDSLCGAWATQNECTANPSFMNTRCQDACKIEL